MQLTDEQFNLIKEQFKTLKDRSPFYAKKFEGIDLADVQTQADFEKLPFSEKADLREAYPLGIASRTRRGSCAHPQLIGHDGHAGHYSLHRAGCCRLGRTMFARCYRTAGITPIRIAFKLPLAMVCGLRASGSSWVASAWALWLFPWVLAIPRSSCK